MAIPVRGEVWLADLGEPRGREQAGRRPVVVLQSNLYETTSTIVVLPITSSHTSSNLALGASVPAGIAGLTKPSLVLCHQIRALDRQRLVERWGELPVDYVAQVEALTMTILGLPL